MPSYARILLDLVIIVVFVAVSVYVYRNYGEDIKALFIAEDRIVMFIDNVAIAITVADDPAERAQGLSGVRELGELEGKLFIFDAEGQHRFWMKDMNFPIDIIFINNDLKVVEIAENVLPESYPTTYTSAEPARFVLETNAFFARSFTIEKGDSVLIPARYMPRDLEQTLQ